MRLTKSPLFEAIIQPILSAGKVMAADLFRHLISSGSRSRGRKWFSLPSMNCGKSRCLPPRYNMRGVQRLRLTFGIGQPETAKSNPCWHGTTPSRCEWDIAYVLCAPITGVPLLASATRPQPEQVRHSGVLDSR